MIVIESSKIVFCDVDDTLLIWCYEYDEEDKTVDFSHPGSGITEKAVPNYHHIDLLRKFHARGHTVVVWSAGGWEWAKKAVEVLGITDIVDLVLSKPDWYIDDLPAEEFMGKPTYLDRRTGKPVKWINKRWTYEDD